VWEALFAHQQFDKMVLIYYTTHTHEINKIQFPQNSAIGHHYISAIIHLSLIMFLSRWKYSHFNLTPRYNMRSTCGERGVNRGMQNITSVLGLRISVCCVAISIIAPQFSLFFSFPECVCMCVFGFPEIKGKYIDLFTLSMLSLFCTLKAMKTLKCLDLII